MKNPCVLRPHKNESEQPTSKVSTLERLFTFKHMCFKQIKPHIDSRKLWSMLYFLYNS